MAAAAATTANISGNDDGGRRSLAPCHLGCVGFGVEQVGALGGSAAVGWGVRECACPVWFSFLYVCHSPWPP